MNKTEIHLLAQEALDAFWQAVASRFPEATGGDLSPHRTLQLNLAAEDAIEDWIANNIPPQHRSGRCPQPPHQGVVKVGHRFRLTRAVDRFPDFLAPAGLIGSVTVADEHGVWAKMDQHVAGAEYWDNKIHWLTEEDFAGDTEPCP